MKKFMVTAAALMLGTSALAWAPAEKAHLEGMHKTSEWSASAAPLSFSAFDKEAKKFQSAAIDSSSTMEKGAELGMKSLAKWSDATVQTASSSSEAKVPTDEGVLIAEADFKSKDDVGGIRTAAATDTDAAGMGGPLETASGYPPCDPGPGDDRCIQLYEPGVRPALAAWKASDDVVAMGGPFEPAATGPKAQTSEHQGMDHGSASGHAGHDMSASAGAKTATATDSIAKTETAKPAAGSVATGTTPGAIGGPVEARTGYPPCRPGRGDDRCIQLYERGVTGRDN